MDVPTPGPGDAVVAVHRVGVCGTDLELASGDMAYFASGRTSYPLRPGHEWSGVVRAVGEGVDPAWVGRRVTGDTMLACGRCDRCLAGRRHVCRDLAEVGISGYPGALAEQLRVPVDSLHHLPDTVDDAAGAMVEPGGNAWRASDAAHAGPGIRVLVWGAGTIGLLAAAFAVAAGAEVHVVARRQASRDLAMRFGVAATWTPERLPDGPIHAVIDATDDPDVPAAAVRARRTGRAGRLHRPRGNAQPHRHARPRVRRPHRGRHPRRFAGTRPRDRAVRGRAGGPALRSSGRTVGLTTHRASSTGRSAATAGPKVHIDPRR